MHFFTAKHKDWQFGKLFSKSRLLVYQIIQPLLILLAFCLPDIIRKDITDLLQVGDVKQRNLLFYQCVKA